MSEEFEVNKDAVIESNRKDLARMWQEQIILLDALREIYNVYIQATAPIQISSPPAHIPDMHEVVGKMATIANAAISNHYIPKR